MNDSETPGFYEIESISDLTITLNGSKPPIYRQLEVSSDITLFELHCIIQTAMGWTNLHLFEFKRGDLIFGVLYEDTFDEFPDLIEAANIKLAGVLKRPGQTINYVYDFGDSWEHKIQLNKHFRDEPGKTYPVCISGSGNCPPEDCGGIHGFYNIMKILKDPKHPEYKETKTWVGKKYDPDTFDVVAVNKKFKKIKTIIKEFTIACYG